VVLPPIPHDFKYDVGIYRILPIFKGLPNENPYTHVREFEEIIRNLCKDRDPDSVKMMYFPSTLKEQAHH